MSNYSAKPRDLLGNLGFLLPVKIQEEILEYNRWDHRYLRWSKFVTIVSQKNFKYWGTTGSPTCNLPWNIRKKPISNNNLI